ncbi:hypothetical protein ACQJBY_030066 [Aegilops geniculata]
MHPNTVQDTPIGVHVWPIGLLLSLSLSSPWGCACEDCILCYEPSSLSLSSIIPVVPATTRLLMPSPHPTSAPTMRLCLRRRLERLSSSTTAAKPPGSRVIFHSGGQISSSLGNTRSAEDAVLVHGSGREKSFSLLFPSVRLDHDLYLCFPPSFSSVPDLHVFGHFLILFLLFLWYC